MYCSGRYFWTLQMIMKHIHEFCLKVSKCSFCVLLNLIRNSHGACSSMEIAPQCNSATCLYAFVAANKNCEILALNDDFSNTSLIFCCCCLCKETSIRKADSIIKFSVVWRCFLIMILSNQSVHILYTCTAWSVKHNLVGELYVTLPALPPINHTLLAFTGYQTAMGIHK